MQALLDGDIALFRAGMAAERTIWFVGTDMKDAGWGTVKQFEYKREATDYLDQVLPGLHSRKEGEDYEVWPEKNLEPVSHAIQNLKSIIRKALEACDCTEWDLKVYLSASGGDTFRHRLAKTRPYKGNRDKSHRPTHEQALLEYMLKTYDCYVAEDEEADDLLGIAQTKFGPMDSVIISVDKDLDQIPGLKYNLMHDVRYDISPERADYNFHLQLMTGDSTDNIPGLPGIGVGKASKALHGLETADEQMEEVIRMYQIHSGKENWEEYLLEQGRLLWIRRERLEVWAPVLSDEDTRQEWGDMDLILEVDE